MRTFTVLVLIVAAFAGGSVLGAKHARAELACTHAHAWIQDGRAVAACDAWTAR